MVGHQRGGMESLTGNVAGQIRSGYDATVLHPLAPKISAITDAYSMELRTARSLTGDPLAQVSPNWIATTGARSARDLERQVSVVVSAFGDHTVDTVTGGQRDAADLGVQDAHALLKRVLAPVRTVGVEPDDLIEAVRGEAKQALVGRSIGGGHLTDLIANLGPQAGDAVHRTLLAGLGTGENPRELANLLYGTLSNNLSRSLTIARTEMLNTYRSAQIANYRANSDVVSSWVWTAGVGACIMCLEMSGTIFPIDADLSSHPNCFPAGTMVSGPRALAGVSRYYAGRLVEIVTASGKQLAVTPNHPILTPQGWVAAGELVEGGYVVSAPVSERPLGSVSPDDYQVPARIEDVAHAPGGARSVRTRRMPTAAEDFHGDGMDGEVCVVRTDGELGDGLKAALTQPRRHLNLCRRHIALIGLSSARAALQAFNGISSASTSGVSSSDLALSLLRSTGSHHARVGFAPTTSLNSSESQPRGDNVARDVISSGDTVLGRASKVVANDRIIRNPSARAIGRTATLTDDAIARRGIPEQATSLERVREALLTGMEARSDDLRALASNVGLDRILKVSSREWSGHVYSLQTVTGWYVADGIIAHNCGCTPVPMTRSWDDILGPLGIDATGIEETSYVPAETGDEWFQRQDAAFQRETLGPAAFNAWSSGNLDLKDLVGQTEDGEYYQRSLKEIGIDARDYLGKNAAYLDREVVVGESSRVFSAVDSASSGGSGLTGLASYTLTSEDRAFVQAIRDQIPAEGITSHTDAIALGAQLRDRVEGTLTELKRFAEEEAAIYTRAPNLTDAERAWAFGEKDAIAAHNGVRWTQAKDRLQEAYQSQMAAYLGEIRSLGGVDVKLATEAEAFDAAVAERIATAKEMLPSDWLRASNDMGEITPIKVGTRNSGGYYQPNYSGDGTLAISYTKNSATGEMESTALHEMIHRMEHTLPGLSDIEGQFYAARTAGEEYVALTNGIKEMTKLDDWLDQYLGRRPMLMGRPTFQLPDGTYKYSTRSYELLSMGVEMLFAPGTDAATFALREDDQFVAFVLGILMGVVAPPVAP